MEPRAGLKIAFIGSGNVATHLAHAFTEAGVEVVQIVSRRAEHAERLARELPAAEAATSPAELRTDLDAVIISASDDSVAEIVSELPRLHRTIAIHTSGTRPAAILAEKAERYGVLYPLQTFSRTEQVDVGRVPFFTEASDAPTLEAIDKMARMISAHVAHADSQRRRTLHVAGVFACNFVTYMWECASRVLAGDDYDFSAVIPLIEATTAKAMAIGPHQAQTGPARRGDTEVMREHIEMLPEDLKTIYRQISNAIMESHNIEKHI